MTDWSEHLVLAKKHLLSAENNLNLKRDAEGAAAILLAMDDLSNLLLSLDTIEAHDRLIHRFRMECGSS